MKITKAVITAAGQGTRLHPCSKYIPKEMFPIGNIPTIKFSLDECLQADISEIGIVCNDTKEILFKYINDLKKNDSNYSDTVFTFIPQGREQGTAKALQAAEKFIDNENFYLIFPDEISYKDSFTAKQLCEAFFECGKISVVGLKEIDKKECSKYGIIRYRSKRKNKFFKIEEIVEKPKTNPPSNYALCGRYIFTPEIFSLLNKITIKGNEFYLTDAIETLAKQNKLFGYKFNNETYDTGNVYSYINTQYQYLLKGIDR